MKKPAKVPVLEILLDARAVKPLQRQLYEGLRETIVLGRLPQGMRLPSSRVLARRLGISRNTVLFAYDELVADGWLNGITGSGTRVALSAQAVRFSDPDGLTLNGFESVDVPLSLRKELGKHRAKRVLSPRHLGSSV